MENQELDDKAKAAPADSSKADNHDQSHADDDKSDTRGGDDNTGGKDGGKKDDEINIPKHRFDEEVEKRKELERRLNERDAFDKRLKEAVNGPDRAQNADDDVERIATKYNVNRDFTNEILDAAEKRAMKKLDPKLGVLTKAQAESEFEREMRGLSKQFPEVEDLTEDEQKKLREMAFDRQYASVPLENVYKIFSYGRPEGRRKTAEGYRPGAARKDASKEKDISDMSLEEFKKYSDNLAKQGR